MQNGYSCGMKAYRLLGALLRNFPPEKAHRLAIQALRTPLLAPYKGSSNAALQQTICGLDFPNPVGMAAGFDKDAEAMAGLLRQGFGFVEVGTVTPLAQPGNPQPRVFRLPQDQAVINRLGFNNNGLRAFSDNLRHRPAVGIVGANLGKNKDSANAIADYVQGIRAVYALADYITINISSPNTQGLRNLQEANALYQLLDALLQARKHLEAAIERRVPLFVKIAPDMTTEERAAIAEVALYVGLDGLIVSNTTTARAATLKSKNYVQSGGLSGAPLFASSTKALRDMYRLTEGKIPLIGVGGISSAQDAYAKIKAGASLVQLYTALIYQGFGLVHSIVDELPNLLERDGYSHISQAIGKDA